MAKELYRITEDGGHVIVTVWYLWPSAAPLWQGKQNKYFKNILKNWKNKVLRTIIRVSGFRNAGSLRDSVVNNLDWNDCMISFTDNKGKKFERFHHAWTRDEIKNLFRQAGFEIERCDIPDGRNILLVGKKINR